MKQKILMVAGSLVLATMLLSLYSGSESKPGQASWWHYGGSPEQSKYFDAEQINKSNVQQLTMAWMYPTADSNSYFFSPVIVDTIMYVMGKGNSLIALHAFTGKKIGIYANLFVLTRRGLNYWQSKDGKDRRLIFTLNNSLQAIDALSGKTILSFGDSGYVDMRVGLNREPSSIRRMQAMMPGVIYDDLVIMGSAPGEGYFSAPGYIRAYNVVTGKLEWTFHTIPLPGEFGYDTWPKDAYKYVGGVNVWSEMTVDTKRGIVFLPLGSPTYDYYGADRLGANLFGNCLVALDAKTGKRLWHYQTIHHDLWDYDLSPAPQLITINRNGQRIDAVSIATKHGYVFVFDRVTGQPLYPIEEKAFHETNMPGDKAWPTQPISSLPDFTRHALTKETLNPYFSDEVKKQWLKRLEAAKSGLFIPPSDKYELIAVPGALGGANYGNTASNPDKGIMYIMAQEYASIYKLNKVRAIQNTLSEADLNKVKGVYTASCQPCHGADMKGMSGPNILNVGQRMQYDDFKNVITNGRGIMPGLVHIDEQTLLALYRYMGGSPMRFNFMGGRGNSNRMPEGPVVASGGAKIKPDATTGAPMSDYPEGVEHPEERYSTDYGTEWPGLLSPPWSYLLAYDLNKGTILWKKPFGQDSAFVQGDQTKGAPSGALRKGMIITKSGLVFATGKGGKVYAYDADNGNTLWETTLSYETNAQPSMYMINGRQYLVINATSNFTRDSYNHSVKPGALPRGYVVYALPNKN